MLLHSFMNWFNMIFKVNKSFERSTTSTTVTLLFFFMNRCIMISKINLIHKTSITFVQLCCFFPSWTDSIWVSKSIWLTNLAPYIWHICSSSWADAVWIISSMWFRKQTLNFSHICCRLWTDNQNQSFSKIPFNFEENFVNLM